MNEGVGMQRWYFSWPLVPTLSLVPRPHNGQMSRCRCGANLGLRATRWWWGLVTSPRRGAARCSLVFCVATPARPQQCGGRLHAGEHEEIHRRKLRRNGDHHLHYEETLTFTFTLIPLLIVYDIKQLSINASWPMIHYGHGKYCILGKSQ